MDSIEYGDLIRKKVFVKPYNAIGSVIGLDVSVPRQKINRYHRIGDIVSVAAGIEDPITTLQIILELPSFNAGNRVEVDSRDIEILDEFKYQIMKAKFK